MELVKKKQLRAVYQFPVAAVTTTASVSSEAQEQVLGVYRAECKVWQGWLLLKTLSMFQRPNSNSSWDLGYVTFDLSSIPTSPLTGSSEQHQFTQVTWGDQSVLRFLPLSYYIICSHWATPYRFRSPLCGRLTLSCHR